MPKSKRNKLVTLSKTKKKTKEWKEGLITTVRNYLDTYPSVYLLRYENMRNDKFKDLREELRGSSRFCMGSNKVLQVALGKSEADEAKQDLHRLSNRIRGATGLFFTTLKHEEVVQVFSEYHELDYARAGAKATEGVELKEGPVEGPYGPLAHTLEPTLRKHLMPVKLNRGVIELVSDYTICNAGDRLNPHQAALLRIFDVKMAVFKFTPLACWRAEGEEFTELAEDDGEGEEDDDLGEGEFDEGN